jgi:hypothetical protein
LIRARSSVLALCLAASACDQPPLKEIEAAEEQVARARQEGAREYAPERFQQAEDALVLARARMQDRDYRGALSAANDAADRARAAIALVEPARREAQASAELALGEIRTALDRAATERAAAVKAGVPRARLVELDARVDKAKAAAAEAQTRMKSPDALRLKSDVDELRTEVAPLADLYRALRTQGRPRASAPGARSGASRRR